MVKSVESTGSGAREERMILMCPDCSETYSRTAHEGYIPPDVCSRCGAKLSPVTLPVSTISSGAVRDRNN